MVAKFYRADSMTFFTVQTERERERDERSESFAEADGVSCFSTTA